MNFNDYPDELKMEEQMALDKLLERVSKIKNDLDKKNEKYLGELLNSDISTNYDSYSTRVGAQGKLKNNAEDEKELQEFRNKLYGERLLLHYKSNKREGFREIKVGLHPYIDGTNLLVTSWKNPICRYYRINNDSVNYKFVCKEKNGEESHTDFLLLVKNKVDFRFEIVKKAVSLYPKEFDKKALEQIKGTGFFTNEFLDKLINEVSRGSSKLEDVENVVVDEFLQELLERRSEREFRNIVFSIQKKQGEIIQLPYDKNIIVQGCAGSGKSMIMLHRLPIVLYDNPQNLNRSKLYIITPSTMYMQMVDKMREELEISDINMGTIEQYYDYCINKYPEYKSDDYGKISYGTSLKPEIENYIYSNQCINDIQAYLDKKTNLNTDFINYALSTLNVNSKNTGWGQAYLSKMRRGISQLNDILSANKVVLSKYYENVIEVIDSFRNLRKALKYCLNDIIREINQEILENRKQIAQATQEIEKLDSKINSFAVKSKNNEIMEVKNKISQLYDELEDVRLYLLILNDDIDTILAPFNTLGVSFNKNTDKVIYDAINETKELIKDFSAVLRDCLEIEDEYSKYLRSIKSSITNADVCINNFLVMTDGYLDYNDYARAKEMCECLVRDNDSVIKDAYIYIMGKIGNVPNNNGNVLTFKCSSYLYLQIIYQYQGAPNGRFESLLSIDEAQSVAPEELRLLRNVNGGKVIFNLFGDIYQHIEGTKGINNWNQYKGIVDFDMNELQENYRNASQITDYCNHQFGMKMDAINTTGKGVHELVSASEFQASMIKQLLDTQREGLSAVLVSDNVEARYLLDVFSEYEQKFNDMTGEEFSMHENRWNIIKIDDAKGLEFGTVVVLSGRMSHNEKYIAFTRALDELFVYSEPIDVSKYKKKVVTTKLDEQKNMQSSIQLDCFKDNDESVIKKSLQPTRHTAAERKKDFSNSEVRSFFKGRGLEVVDKRADGDRLWIVGKEADIKNTVKEAISKFNISGRYCSSKKYRIDNGWCTKTDK